MHSVKEQYRDINPVTVIVIEANVTSSLYCGAVHGLDAPGADLVEAFLVELYRCRVCQFTSSLKSSIKTHLLDSHDDLPPAMAASGFEEDGEEEAAVMEEHHAPPRAPDSPYHLEHELTSESKHSDDDPMDHMGLDRMAFLLPMYGILPSISPRSCDMGLSSNCEGGLQVAETCEVSTLFEDPDDEQEGRAEGEDAAIFTLKACPDGACSEPLSYPLAHPAPNPLDEQLAQSAHLMTLGLCRISRTPKVAAPPAPRPQSPPESKESPPPPQPSSDPPGDRLGAAAAAAETLTAGRACRRCGKRMRRQGRTKSCRTCQHAARTRRSRDAQASDGRSTDRRTADAHGTRTAAERDAHAAGARRASAGRGHASSTRAQRTHKDHAHTPDTQACSHEAWLNCVFCDTPPSSHQPIRGIGHNGTDSAQPSRTRKRKGSPERRIGQKKSGPAVGAGRREVCCLLCDRKFSSRLTLRRHMGIHQGSKPYGCQLCPYRSRLKASLLQHNRIHTGEKPHQCPQPGCSYASIDRSSLLRHSRTHTQQRPYHCPHCPYSCIQKKSLDLHARRHHTGESFPCQQCPYSSPDRQLLLRHVRRHHQPVALSP